MGKYKSDYTITVLSASLYQYGNIRTQAPATLGPFGSIPLRLKCAPYVAGSTTAIDKGMRGSCFPPPPTPTISALSINPGGQPYPFTWDFTEFMPSINPGARIYPFTWDFTEFMPSINPGAQAYGITSFDSNFFMPLMTPGGISYSPSLVWDQIESLSLITPGGQPYGPAAVLYEQFAAMNLIAPGGQPYAPTFTEHILMSLLIPGGQPYGITVNMGVSMPLLIPGGQPYTLTWNIGETMPLLIPGGQPYGITSWAEDMVMPLMTPGGKPYDPTICPLQYTVGTGGDYATIQLALTKVESLSQPLECRVEILISGSTSYAENVVIKDITTTATNTLTLTQWGGTVAQTIPIIDGGVVSGQSEACLWIKDVDNVILDGLKFQGWGWTSAGGPNLTSEPPGAASVFIGRNNLGSGLDKITLQNCLISAEQGGEYGIYSASGSTGTNTDLTIYNCILTGSDTSVNSGSYGLSFNSTYNSTVSASTIRGWNTHGVNIVGDGLSTYGDGITLRQSEISRCYGVGLYIGDQWGCVIKNNLIYSCATASSANTIYLYGEQGGTTYYYNTIVGTSSIEDLIRFVDWTSYPKSYFKNNIYRFATTDPGGTKAIYSFSHAPTSEFNSDYNLFSVIQYSGSDIHYDNVASCDVCDGGGQAYYPLLSTAPNDWQSAYSKDVNSQEDHGPNPAGIFHNGAGLKFTLIAGSVAIGAALDVGITVDKAGYVRPYDTYFDQGCYEYRS